MPPESLTVIVTVKGPPSTVGVPATLAKVDPGSFTVTGRRLNPLGRPAADQLYGGAPPLRLIPWSYGAPCWPSESIAWPASGAVGGVGVAAGDVTVEALTSPTPTRAVEAIAADTAKTNVTGLLKFIFAPGEHDALAEQVPEKLLNDSTSGLITRPPRHGEVSRKTGRFSYNGSRQLRGGPRPVRAALPCAHGEFRRFADPPEFSLLKCIVRARGGVPHFQVTRERSGAGSCAFPVFG